MKNRLREMKNNKKGFTLIEMIVVIVIIAILVALAVPAVMGYVDDAREAKLRAAASAGTTTMQTAMAKSESLGELDKTKLDDIVKSGISSSGATTILICTDEEKTTACGSNATYNPESPDESINSLDDIKRFIFTIGDKVVIQPATGGGEATILPAPTTPPAK